MEHRQRCNNSLLYLVAKHIRLDFLDRRNKTNCLSRNCSNSNRRCMNRQMDTDCKRVEMKEEMKEEMKVESLAVVLLVLSHLSYPIVYLRHN